METAFYRQLAGQQVQCRVCAHFCRIEPGGLGRCGQRLNDGGRLDVLNYGRLVAGTADPVEKKPLYHYRPGSSTFSVAAEGCNFTCAHCQNHHLSQKPSGPESQVFVSPPGVVRQALASGCPSLAYTYTEPTIFFEWARDAARLALEAGLENIWVTNGFFSPQVRMELPGLIAAANIDLKGFKDSFYQEICGGRLKPVLQNIATLVTAGVWVEVTTLLIPGLNDDPRDLKAQARWLYGLSPDMVWHLSAFRPQYKLKRLPPTPPSTLRMAYDLGREAGLSFVYAGSGPGASSFCPGCGAELLTRGRLALTGRRLTPEGRCPDCGRPIPGRWSGTNS